MPATNVADLLRRRASREGDKVALVDGDRRVTWAELDAMVDKMARGLAALGLVGGHRVAIAMTNSVGFVVCYLAVLRGGMVAVLLNPMSTSGEVGRVLADSGARICVTDATAARTVREAVAGAVDPLIVVADAPLLPGEYAYDELTGTGRAAVRAPRDIESLAVLLYTSGTGGEHRGAMLSHRALLANIEQASRTKPAWVRPDDTVLGVLPLFHGYGLGAVLGQVLLQGATLVLGWRLQPDETLRLIAAEGVTCAPVAPHVIADWSQRPDGRQQLGSVRTLISGAVRQAERSLRDFEAQVGVRVEQGYGLTEAGPIVTSTIGTAVRKPGSAGQALPGVGLRVVDETGNPAHADDPGQILVRGRNLFSGYWPDGDGGPDAEGWLATGDIGLMDNDGDLFLVGRVEERVVVSGFNVYPAEIEAVIDQLDGVVESAVLGVPDAQTGEAVVAYVVPAVASDADALRDRVRAHCEQRVARFKVPSAVEVVGELPHAAVETRRAMGLA
ncbi:MAG: AMP-binding protein [Nocardioidaceae bacterium]|nr:AMP-binding protein [Nocardioidaceae bacterium]